MTNPLPSFLAVVAGAIVALFISLTVLSQPAEAFVEEVGGVKVGLQLRETAHYWQGTLKWNGLGKGEVELNLPAAEFGNDPHSPSQPGPVLHTAVSTYVIYWDPQDYYNGDWQNLIDKFMANLGSSGGELGNVFALDAQYTDQTDQPATSKSVFHGAYTDTNPYPQSEGCIDPHASLEDWNAWKIHTPLLETGEPACLTDGQIRTQLETFIAEQHGVKRGMGTIFYLLTPPGVTVCLGAGGPSGRCSDFNGSLEEISSYEEEANSYAERREEYEKQLAAYEKAKEKYEEEKAEKEAKGETDTAEPPVEPKEPKLPTRPASYGNYTKSFCSYHSAIDTTNSSGGENTILYAVIPWTAGGNGDGHLAAAEKGAADDCQDGGFEPGTKANGEIQEKEREKPRTPKEEEEFKEKSEKEQREEEEARELGLVKPHEQEPNQLGSVRSPDGSFDEGLADLITNQIAVEQQNTVTDPLLNGWQDPAGSEVTDECRNFFFASGSASANPQTRAGMLSNQSLGGGNYYLNSTFNLASQLLPYPAVPCLTGVTLQPEFTAPNPVNTGEIVGFDGMESDITLDSAIGFAQNGSTRPDYATYTWNFGDGSPEVSGAAPGAPSQNSPSSSPCALPWQAPCAASTFHAYQYGGTYRVTLTVKDVGGNTGSVSKLVTVVGPPPPSPPSPESSPSPSTTPSGPGAAPGSGSGAAGGKGSGSPQDIIVPAPVLTATLMSTSLRHVKRSGLAVHYTTNEQVAGTLQVLLESAVAKRLGIHGSVATGLPQGSPKFIVVGTAVLVTTKAGQGTIRVKFSSRTAARLSHTHKLKLTLRLFARNASRQSPQSTTLLSTVVVNP
jgi:hypothetical protein